MLRPNAKALVIAVGGGIGDVLLATPVVRALRARYDEVVVLTTRAHREVLLGNPDVADVWTVDGVPLAAEAGRIAAAGFDAAIVTWATPRTALLPFLARVPVRVGQARRLYSGLFTKRVTVRSELGDHHSHWTQVLLDFARALDCDVTDGTPLFVIDDAQRSAARRALAGAGIDGPYVVLHPTRGIAAARERWPVARLAALGRALAAETGRPLVVSGGASDAAISATVAEGAGGTSLSGRLSIGEFGALAQGASAVVALDSGPMHVAAAVGAPTVGIFALRSDEPQRWAPLGPRTAVVLPDYPCPPQHRKETCPDFACIANLEIPRVLTALRGLLAVPLEAQARGNAEG